MLKLKSELKQREFKIKAFANPSYSAILRIYLESFDNELINQTCEALKTQCNENKYKIVGPIALPTKRRIYCLLRSPHVDKDSREHLEIRTYKRIFDIYFTNEPLNDFKLDIPAGVLISSQIRH